MIATPVACPFASPSTSRQPFGEGFLEQERFAPREGLAFTRNRVTAAEAAADWPFASFLQVVFVMRGEVSLGLPDAADRSFVVGEWFVLSRLDWQARCRFASGTELLALECSSELWDALTPQYSFLDHSMRACFVCSQRQEAMLVGGRAKGELLALVERLGKAETRTAAQRLSIEASALTLLVTVVEDLSLSGQPEVEPCVRSESEEAILAAARYIDANLGAEHSLASIGRVACLNEFKLKKGFREVLGQTVFGYLRQKRMEAARRMFDAGERSVIEVANALGYSNPSHFARAFRAAHGINPKRYAGTLAAR